MTYGEVIPRVVMAGLVAATVTACHGRTTGAPLLSSVTPTQVNISGGASASVLLRGHGFEAQNVVHIGRLRVPGVARLSDSTLQFVVPVDDTFLPDRGPAPVRPLASGAYEVRIENRRGTSNAMTLTLVNSREAR